MKLLKIANSKSFELAQDIRRVTAVRVSGLAEGEVLHMHFGDGEEIEVPSGHYELVKGDNLTLHIRREKDGSPLTLAVELDA